MSQLQEQCKDGLAAVLAALQRQDAVQAIIIAEEINRELLDAQAAVAAARRSAIRDLRTQGFTLREIGDAVGLSNQRIYQLETGYGRKEKKADEIRLSEANKKGK